MTISLDPDINFDHVRQVNFNRQVKQTVNALSSSAVKEVFDANGDAAEGAFNGVKTTFTFTYSGINDSFPMFQIQTTSGTPINLLYSLTAASATTCQLVFEDAATDAGVSDNYKIIVIGTT